MPSAVSSTQARRRCPPTRTRCTGGCPPYGPQVPRCSCTSMGSPSRAQRVATCTFQNRAVELHSEDCWLGGGGRLWAQARAGTRPCGVHSQRAQAVAEITGPRSTAPPRTKTACCAGGSPDDLDKFTGSRPVGQAPSCQVWLPPMGREGLGLGLGLGDQPGGAVAAGSLQNGRSPKSASRC